jgi:hypothetical protein
MRSVGLPAVVIPILAAAAEDFIALLLKRFNEFPGVFHCLLLALVRSMTASDYRAD